MKHFIPTDGWGPAHQRAALSITFDNLGEAAELELGIWGDRPVGTHHTASFLPRLIEVLGDLRATYFIEAINCEMYPSAIRAWAAAGHEVGLHAWRHEGWDRCEPTQRRALLARSLLAMRALGIEPVGFRPPGGVIPRAAWDEFAEAGLLYCSELGDGGVAMIGNVVSVPFAWRAVDVYMSEAVMGFMRVACGDQEQAYSLATWQSELDSRLATALADGGHLTVIFHPNFLGEADAKLNVLRHLIATARTQDIWIAPGRDIAAFAAQGMSAQAAVV